MTHHHTADDLGDIEGVKYGKDHDLEGLAEKLLAESVADNTRSIERDIEKMAYESGLITSDELQHYDPTNDWDTNDSAFAILVAPFGIQYLTPTMCAEVDDGNVIARNRKARERQALTKRVNDAVKLEPTAEKDIPLLGVNDGPRKVCTKCTQSKGLQYFSTDRRNKDGLHSWCKPCHRSHKRLTYEKRNNSRSKGRAAQTIVRECIPHPHS